MPTLQLTSHDAAPQQTTRPCVARHNPAVGMMPQDVQAGFHIGSPCDPSHHHLAPLLRQRFALVVAQHAWTTQVSRRL